MGNERVTQKGLEIVRIDAGENLLIVRGSVPGSKSGFVEVRTDA
jgi:large subunit ribosomal protein L3